MIDLQVSGTFESNNGAKMFAEDLDSSSFNSETADDEKKSSVNKFGFNMKYYHRRMKNRNSYSTGAQGEAVLSDEEISDKTGFLFRKQLHMKKKLELHKKSNSQLKTPNELPHQIIASNVENATSSLQNLPPCFVD